HGRRRDRGRAQAGGRLRRGGGRRDGDGEQEHGEGLPSHPSNPTSLRPMQPGAFEGLATDGAARAATLATAHGPVETPALMPVGTKASVKAMDPAELVGLGAQVVLGNTYHLHFRPGEDVIAQLGGLHAFMGWDRPILTDSGGFQVFSLLDTAKIDADG